MKNIIKFNLVSVFGSVFSHLKNCASFESESLSTFELVAQLGFFRPEGTVTPQKTAALARPPTHTHTQTYCW